MIDPDTSSRAGFWRRVIAFVLDLILICALIACIGVVLAGATDGKVRVANTLVDYATCTTGGPKPEDLQLPSDFKITAIRRCTHYVFGKAHDWSLGVFEVTRTGPNSTYTRSVTVPVDPAGHVTEAFYLDYLTIFVLAAYWLLLEWQFGTTPGKRILGVRVRPLGGGPMSLAQSGRRTAIRMIPFVPAIVACIYQMAVGPVRFVNAFLEQPAINLLVGGAICLVLLLAFVVNFIVTTRRRTLPWHDHGAGTEAVRG